MAPVPAALGAMALRPKPTKSMAAWVAQDEQGSKNASKIQVTPLVSATKSKPTATPLRRPPVFIALDCGTTFLKGGFWIGEASETNTGPALPYQLDTIRWPNGAPIARAQAALKLADNTWVFGDDVAQALKSGETTEAERMYYLKPMVYEEELEVERQVDEDRTRQQGLVAAFGNLEIEDRLTACGESVLPDKLPKLQVFAGLMEWCWKAAVSDISHKHPDLNWNSLTQSAAEEQFPPCDQNVRVAILVPATTLSSVQHRQFMVAAAETAGIPNFELVSEPAAALAYYIINNRQTTPPKRLLGKTFMMIDLGAGSVDFEVWTILSLYPLRVRVEVAPVTKWLGARQVNNHAKNLILEGIQYPDELLSGLSILRGQEITYNSLGKELDDHLEVGKRYPNGVEERHLRIPDLPMEPNSRLCGAAGVLLSESDMVVVQDKYIDPIIDATFEILEKVTNNKLSRGDNTNLVDGIITTGGGILNRYAQEKFRQKMGEVSSVALGYAIPVDFPTTTLLDWASESLALTQVALGGVLLLVDNDLVAERVVDRSYFVAKLDDTGMPEGTVSCHPTYFARKGHPFDPKKKMRIQCYGRVWDTGSDKLEVKEEIFYSDSITEDSVVLDHHEAKALCASTLPWKFTLSREELAGIDLYSAPPDSEAPCATFWGYEYLLDMSFDGRHVHFAATIPRSGVVGLFQDVGPNPIRRIYTVDIKGAIRPLGGSE